MNIRIKPIKIDLFFVFTIIIIFFSTRYSGIGVWLYALEIIWIVFAFNNSPDFLSDTKYMFLWLFLLLIILLCSAFGTRSNGPGNAARYLSLFIGAFVFDYYKKDKESLEKLLIATFLIWLFYVVRALQLYEINPNAARLIISHQGEQFSNVAIGGAYGLAFGVSLMIPSLVCLIKCKKLWNRKAKLFWIGCVILFLRLLVLTQSFITLCASLIGMIMAIFFYSDEYTTNISKNVTIKKLLGAFSLIIPIILILFNRDAVGRMLLNWHPVGLKAIDERIQETGAYLLTSEVGIAGMGRITVYIRSIDTILHKPLLGSIFYNGFPTKVGVGGHSEILDTFALYGILVGALLLVWYLRSISYHKYNKSIRLVGCGFVSVSLIFFNQFTYTSGALILFFFVPAVSYYLTYYCEERKK